jgi:hypothetical protein
MERTQSPRAGSVFRTGTPPVAIPELAFFHGPDKTPIYRGPGDAEPFHGVISRGLLAAVASGRLGHADWRECAHRLFDDSKPDMSALLALREEARQRRVLSFRQSAAAVRRYVDRCLGEKRLRFGCACEVWNIKEGHTSSVWRVAIRGDDADDEFVVNVARDAEAGMELLATAETMRSIAAAKPDLNMAKVIDAGTTTIEYFDGTIEVAVTRNELVPNALEVHRGTHRVTGLPTYVVIERFVTSEDHPSEIRSLVGRVLQPAECRKLESNIERFLAAASQCGTVALDINEGDVVWDGADAVVIAIR